MSASDRSVQQFGVATQSLPHTPLGVISNQTAVSVTMTVDGGIGKFKKLYFGVRQSLPQTSQGKWL